MKYEIAYPDVSGMNRAAKVVEVGVALALGHFKNGFNLKIDIWTASNQLSNE